MLISPLWELCAAREWETMSEANEAEVETWRRSSGTSTVHSRRWNVGKHLCWIYAVFDERARVSVCVCARLYCIRITQTPITIGSYFVLVFDSKLNCFMELAINWAFIGVESVGFWIGNRYHVRHNMHGMKSGVIHAGSAVGPIPICGFPKSAGSEILFGS